MADARTTASALDGATGPKQRRDFLKLAALGGMGLVLPAVITACNDDPLDPTKEATLNFGNDTGPLNLAYAITQMQADFYARITANRFTDYTSVDSNTTYGVNAVSTQKTNVRNLLQVSITSGRITDAVLFNFSTIDFSSRASVMNNLRIVEDAGVQAIVGSLAYVKNATNALFLAQIASVMARGAAQIRDVMDRDAQVLGTSAAGNRVSFAAADVVEAGTAAEKGITPSAWLDIYRPYYLTNIKLSGV